MLELHVPTEREKMSPGGRRAMRDMGRSQCKESAGEEPSEPWPRGPEQEHLALPGVERQCKPDPRLPYGRARGRGPCAPLPRAGSARDGGVRGGRRCKNCLSAAKADNRWLWGSELCRGPLSSVSSWLKYMARQRCRAGDMMSP